MWGLPIAVTATTKLDSFDFQTFVKSASLNVGEILFAQGGGSETGKVFLEWLLREGSEHQSLIPSATFYTQKPLGGSGRD